MHSYSTDTKERIQITFFLAVVSVFLHIGFTKIIPPTVVAKIGLPSLGISITVVFGILFALFDRWCWKWKIWRWLGLVQIPDINGQWQGYVKTSYDGLQNEYPLSITIKQNWCNFSMHSEADQSKSYSFTGSILVREHEGKIIHYAYRCKPHMNADNDMIEHLGTTIMTVKGDVLEGEYFTSHGRSNTGYIKLKRAKT